MSEEDFMSMARTGEFVEWAKVHGNLYGTSRKRLEELRDQGINVILDVDTQGAKKMKSVYEDGVFIFILPPTMDALRERLEKRMSNSPEEMEVRLKRASDEIRDYKMYDYVIVNSDFAEALMELKSIIIAEQRRADTINPEWVRHTFGI